MKSVIRFQILSKISSEVKGIDYYSLQFNKGEQF